MTYFKVHLIAMTARSAAFRLAVPRAQFDLPTPVVWRLNGNGPEQTGLAATVVLVLHDLEPDTEYRLQADGFAPIIFQTWPCSGELDIRDFGASQASADNSAAIEAAIAAVPANGSLLVPAGQWWTRPVFLKSDMTLRLTEGARLCAVGARGGWTRLPARDEGGRMLGSWEGLPADCFAAVVTAIKARNLAITGPGRIDGGGDRGDWWSWPKETRDGARRPRTLHLIGCTDVSLLGFGVCNSPSWTVHPQGCRRLTVAGLTIENPPDSPNTDGLNPDGCEDVTIEGVRFSVGDDCIAIKSGKRAPGIEDHLAATRRIAIRHCLMERGHGGVVLGSEMSGGIHDIIVEDCIMRATDRGLRIKTRRGRGGEVSGICLRRISMQGVLSAITINAFYFCDPDGHSDWVQSRDSAPVNAATPQISDIEISDVTVSDLSFVAIAALGLPEAPIRGVRVDNLTVRFAPDAQAGPPLMADDVDLLRHEGIWSQWAEIEVVNCDIPANHEISV